MALRIEWLKEEHAIYNLSLNAHTDVNATVLETQVYRESSVRRSLQLSPWRTSTFFSADGLTSASISHHDKTCSTETH